MTYRIKNMVCDRCVAAVKAVLASLGVKDYRVELGTVSLAEPLEESVLKSFDAGLHELGFQRVSDPAAELIERAKAAVLQHVRNEAECHLKLSACIEHQLGVPYDTVSRLFSQLEGRTIEKFHIAHKVERVKELLSYGGRSLDEIADISGYSSGAHLSRQFKAVTGLTPTAFVQLGCPRNSLDKI